MVVCKYAKMLVTAFFLSTFLSEASGGGNVEFLSHAGKSGTQHNRNEDSKDYYTSNSRIPILPFITGFMGTHGTYRFLNIIEQTAVMIGEPKHGMWRIQENGFMREYRKSGLIGLQPNQDPNASNLTADQLAIIKNNYASYIPEESWAGYKYPDEKTSDEFLNFIDISIYHPKYDGKYNAHVAIDLPHFYCTMSQDDYPYVWNAWKYAMAQPMANKMGPLAKRAGLDIKENYLNVLQFNFFSDAALWANVGTGDNATDLKVKNMEELRNRAPQTVNYQRVDMSKMDVEVYLFERPFFNRPYLFITLVVDNKQGASAFSYVRKNGAYWAGLQKNGKSAGVMTVPDHFPKVHVENYKPGTETRIHGLPLYGMHHPNRKERDLTGGACPERGGDWGRYPWSNSGSGWPTQYQEITPVCDGIVVDIKVWANLWQAWDDVQVGLGNAAFDSLTVNYTVDANVYGRYTDPYLLQTKAENPYAIDLTADGAIVEVATEPKPEQVVFKLNFTRLGTILGYNNVSGLKVQTTPSCPETPTETPTAGACPPAMKCECHEKEDEVVPGWVISQLVQLAVLPGFFLVLPFL